MKSPFAWVRKNQKIMMAAAVLLAIFAFVFADLLTRAPMGRRGTDQVVVETTAGNLTRSNVDALLRRRQAANMFMQRAAELCEIPPQQLPLFRFGDPDMRKDVVFGYLLSLEAEKIGIIVDNVAVGNFIDRFTQNKLGGDDFSKISKDMGVGQKAIYDALRGELQARTAMQLMMPTVPLAPEQYWDIYKKLEVQQVVAVAPVYTKDFLKDVPDPGDAKLREYFETYKTKYENQSEENPSPGFKQPRQVELQYLALRFAAVRERIEKSNPVTDKAVDEYYAANKEQFLDDLPDLDLDSEGDQKPFEEGDQKPFEEGDRKPLSAPIDPLFAPEPGSNESGKTGKPKAEPEKKTEAKAKAKAKAKAEAEAKSEAKEDKAKPAETDAEKPAPKPAKKEEKRAPKKPTEEKPPKEKPSKEKPSEKQSALPLDGPDSVATVLTEVVQAQAESQSESQPGSQPKEPVKKEPVKEAAKKAASKTQKGSASDTEGPALQQPEEVNAGLQDAQSDPKAASAEAEMSQKSTGKESEKKSASKPEPKYRELDDDLRDEIRSILLVERTRAEITKLAAKIRDEMGDLSADHSSALEVDEEGDGTIRKPDADAIKAEAKKAEADLQRLAQATGTKYLDTGLVSYFDLRMPKKIEEGQSPLGDRLEEAARPSSTGLSRGGFPTAELAFGDTMLYSPHQVEGPIHSDQFFFWKVADEEEHVSSWAAPGIRERVLESWKLTEARKLAKQRADALVQAAADKDFAEGLPDGVEFGETARFPWLYQPSPGVNPSPYSRQPPPSISAVTFTAPIGDESGILEPGEKFMETVFHELSVGQVGVAVNRDRSAYYVVQVKSRDTVDPEIVGETFMKTRMFTPAMLRAFMSTPYDEISSGVQQNLVFKWAEELRESHGLHWIDDDADAG